MAERKEKPNYLSAVPCHRTICRFSLSFARGRLQATSLFPRFYLFICPFLGDPAVCANRVNGFASWCRGAIEWGCCILFAENQQLLFSKKSYWKTTAEAGSRVDRSVVLVMCLILFFANADMIFSISGSNVVFQYICQYNDKETHGHGRI
ncbi:hypothetical protein CEXT_794561 [Caerostris extrusa]|uniref:Uncharacterized protein n=1 Tax=Caerostris extrusa TaxID=172846 RepID=A0AAV4WNJ9_CAEEX|nr:hypothetical protein CEXT_794561 [Caerostris extrusa]